MTCQRALCGSASNLNDLELIFSIFGSFMERSVVTETANVVDPVKTFNAVRDSVHLKHTDSFGNRRDGVNLEVWVPPVKETAYNESKHAHEHTRKNTRARTPKAGYTGRQTAEWLRRVGSGAAWRWLAGILPASVAERPQVFRSHDRDTQTPYSSGDTVRRLQICALWTTSQ